MKTTIIFVSAMLLLLVTACTKDNAPATVTPASANKNTPTCAYIADEMIGGNWKRVFYFFDLDHADNKDKKYFKAIQKYGSSDSMEIMLPPQSIESFAPGFPADIRDYPGYGGAGQWTNADFVLNSTSGQFVKDPIPKNPASNLYFLNQEQFVGAMAGKWPQGGRVGMVYPDGMTNSYQRNILFYFKYSICFSRSTAEQNYSGGSIKNIRDLIPGNYDWPNVSSVLTGNTIGSTDPSIYQKLFFLDFKNWQYFTNITDTDGPFMGIGYSQVKNTSSVYKSLDNLLKWPEGWGKK